MAVQVAEGQAEEDGGSPEGSSLALQGVKDLGRSVGKAGNLHRLQKRVSLQEAAKSLGFLVGEIDEWETDFIGAMTLEGDG